MRPTPDTGPARATGAAGGPRRPSAAAPGAGAAARRAPRTPPAYAAEPYYHPSPSVPSAPVAVTLSVDGRPIELQTDRGVFSYAGLDAGTAVLVRYAPAPPPGAEAGGDLLDLGCGYGPIAITLALRHPERTVWAVDVNERARALTEANSSRLGLANVRVCTPEAASGAAFAAIYSNPPVRVGKGTMRGLMLEWLARLIPAGRAYWVVKKDLGADAVAAFLTDAGWPTTRLRAKQGYRLLESLRGAPAPDPDRGP